MGTKRNITEREILDEFRQGIALEGRWRIRKSYGDGRSEEYMLHNTVTGAGRNELAARSIVTSRDAFDHMAAGSGSDGSAIGDSALTYEVIRKSATMSSSNEVIIGVCCFGGAADSLTSSYLDEAGLFTTADSGTGIMLNRLTGIDHTFAESDVVEAHMEVSVGSYA